MLLNAVLSGESDGGSTFLAHPTHETSDHKDASFSHRCFCASFLEIVWQWHHPFDAAFWTAAVAPTTHNHSQTVAAFIICHTEADLHADCTCMNAHTLTSQVFLFYYYFRFFVVVLFVFFLHFVLPGIPLVLGVFSSRIL